LGITKMRLMKAKKIYLGLALILLVGWLSAQDLSLNHTPSDNPQTEYKETEKLYKKQFTKGIILNIIGGLTLGGGIAYFLELDPFHTGMYEDIKFTLGSLFMGAGAAQVIVGSINLAKSRKTKDKLKALKPTISFNPILSPTSTSFGHNINFKAGAALRISF
jgi:hypothetical protein